MDAAQRTTFEETPENLAAEEAAFEAAINGTDIEAPAPETTATETEKPAAEEVDPEEEQDPQQPGQGQDQPAAGATEQQPAKEPTIADLLAVIEDQKTEQQKLRDKVFGKVGELQQKIEAIKTTASGISPKARERLMNDFPELAEMLFEPIEAAQEVETPAAVAAPQTQATAQEDPAKSLEFRLLTRDHRDWQQVVASPEFSAWKDSVLSPEDAAALDDSWDADFVSAKITEFKAYQAEETKKAQARQQKQERLDAALTPQGRAQRHTSSLGEDDEEAAMLANFKPR